MKASPSVATIATLAQIVCVANAERAMIQPGLNSVEGDEQGVSSVESPDRRRLKLRHTNHPSGRKLDGQRKRRIQKGAEESYDPYLGLPQQRELQQSMPMSMPASSVPMCEFCPNGIPDPEYILPTNDGATCGTVDEYAATLTAEDAMCATVQLAEALCCRPGQNVPEEVPVSTTSTTTVAATTAAEVTTTTSATTEEPMKSSTTTATEATLVDLCSCSPTQYTFKLDLSRNCQTDDLANSPGIPLTLCQVEGTSNNQNPEDITITSIQFLEFDTSGNLIVINQDDTYADTNLGNGDEVTFQSISADLDASVELEDQLDYLPGGMQIAITGYVTDGAGDNGKSDVSNRLTWSYTNGCDVKPVMDGDSIGWITFDGIAPAHTAFCPVPETPIVTTEAPIVTETPTTVITGSKSSKSVKTGKSIEKKTKTSKTVKNPMAKVQKEGASKAEDSSPAVDPKSGKAKVDLDAKAKKHHDTKAEKHTVAKGDDDNVSEKPAKKQSSNDKQPKGEGSNEKYSNKKNAKSGKDSSSSIDGAFDNSKSGKHSKKKKGEDDDMMSMDGKSGKAKALKLFAKRHHSFVSVPVNDAAE